LVGLGGVDDAVLVAVEEGDVLLQRRQLGAVHLRLAAAGVVVVVTDDGDAAATCSRNVRGFGGHGNDEIREREREGEERLRCEGGGERERKAGGVELTGCAFVDPMLEVVG
jgi:hypothetical protein